MFGIKGYRAREAAARLRNNRNLVSEEVRAARHAVLPDKIDQPAAEVEVPVTDETPVAQTEPVQAEVEATEKVEAEVTEKVEGEPKAEEPKAAKAKGKKK
ncbi:putative membrane protein [Bradyrhizobium sp. AZCC 1610]|uniref:hypothetical protein n=1 Tax=Bradyrhizobium sp. AZCC 1610 TaxID=3117020 RepID=UPI002FF1F906